MGTVGPAWPGGLWGVGEEKGVRPRFTIGRGGPLSGGPAGAGQTRVLERVICRDRDIHRGCSDQGAIHLHVTPVTCVIAMIIVSS